jgi:hypothetical protein
LIGKTITFLNEFNVTYLTINEVRDFVAVIMDWQEVHEK